MAEKMNSQEVIDVFCNEDVNYFWLETESDPIDLFPGSPVLTGRVIKASAYPVVTGDALRAQLTAPMGLPSDMRATVNPRIGVSRWKNYYLVVGCVHLPFGHEYSPAAKTYFAVDEDGNIDRSRMFTKHQLAKWLPAGPKTMPEVFGVKVTNVTRLTPINLDGHNADDEMHNRFLNAMSV